MFTQPINQLLQLWEDILIYTANRLLGWMNYVYDRCKHGMAHPGPWDGREEKE